MVDICTHITAGQCISIKSYVKLNQLGEGSAYPILFTVIEQQIYSSQPTASFTAPEVGRHQRLLRSSKSGYPMKNGRMEFQLPPYAKSLSFVL